MLLAVVDVVLAAVTLPAVLALAVEWEIRAVGLQCRGRHVETGCVVLARLSLTLVNINLNCKLCT